MHHSLILAGILVLATPALAENTVPQGTARYSIQSSNGGFVRLDTETGAVSHCRQTDGTWRCDTIAEDSASLEKQIGALSDQVTTLKSEVVRLKDEVAALKAAGVPPQTSLTPEEEREFDKAMGFAERLMKRFFEMVRDLKGDEKQSI